MRFNPRRCRECRRSFVPKRFDQDFCDRACRRAWHSWREARGASAVELLVKWRRARLPGSFAKLTAFAENLIREIRDGAKARQGFRARRTHRRSGDSRSGAWAAIYGGPS